MKKIIYIDASSLKYSSCIRRFNWKVVDGFSSIGDDRNYKAGYGTCIHHAFANVFRGMDWRQATKLAKEEYESRWESYVPLTHKTECRFSYHLEAVLIKYFKEYGPFGGFEPLVNPNDNTPFVEIKFQFPYQSTANHDYLLAGTIDLVGHYAGYKTITDHKVTARWNKETFMDDFNLNIQAMFYPWMYRELTGELIPFLVNGIFIKKQTDKGLKEGRFDGVEFKRSRIMQFTEQQMEVYSMWLKLKLSKIIDAIENGQAQNLFDYAACHANPLQACEYLGACAIDAELHRQYLKANFTEQQYNPLLFQE